MQFVFLGTSSGVPTLQRNVSGLAVQASGQKAWVLVDCGEGTQHQLLRAGWSLRHLAAICITHVHGDHCYGLPGLLASAGMAGRTEPVRLIAPAPIQALLHAVVQTTDLHLPFALEFVEVATLAEAGTEALALPGLTVRAVALSHRVPSYAYCLRETAPGPKLNVAQLRADAVPEGTLWGRLQRGEDVQLADGRRVCAAAYQLPPPVPPQLIVAGDNDQPELLSAHVDAHTVLVHEATFTQEQWQRTGRQFQHSSAQQVAAWAQTTALAGLILTHFSARYHGQAQGVPALTPLMVEAAAHFFGPMFLANDLDTFVWQGGLLRGATTAHNLRQQNLAFD